MKRLYAIRGAACAENNADSITESTLKMCSAIFTKNKINENDIVSIQFTLTKDLDAKNPCAALRKGYSEIDISKIPLFCSQEAFIQGGLEKVIRVLITVYLEENSKIENVYINGAEVLRPDFCKKN